MDLESLFPFESKKSIRGLILSILVNESPLKTFEITALIRKRYGRKISFQAVSKEILYLVNEDVLIKKDRDISINKEWVQKVKNNFEEIYNKVVLGKKLEKKSLGEEISVFDFNSLKEMMDYWYKIIGGWFKGFNKGDYNVNCYQSYHAWEVLLHLDKEEETIGQLKKKGIKSYFVTGSTKLDKNIVKFYKKIGAKAKSIDAKTTFDKTYLIGTYGDIIVQIKLPEEIIIKIDNFFKKHQSIDSYNLSELLKIIKSKQKISMTVIKNLEMAKHINKSILNNFK